MRKRWALIALAALSVGCAHSGKNHDKHMEEEDESNEVKMSINDVPAPVRAGLMREAGGATIKTVDKEDRKGKTVYEIDVMSGGKNWEIVVDGDGKLVSRQIDNEEAEKAAPKKEAKEDDDEKEEKSKK